MGNLKKKDRGQRALPTNLWFCRYSETRSKRMVPLFHWGFTPSEIIIHSPCPAPARSLQQPPEAECDALRPAPVLPVHYLSLYRTVARCGAFQASVLFHSSPNPHAIRDQTTKYRSPDWNIRLSFLLVLTLRLREWEGSLNLNPLPQWRRTE